MAGHIEQTEGGFIAKSVFRNTEIHNTKYYRIYCICIMVAVPMTTIFLLSILIARKLLGGSGSLNTNRNYIRNSIGTLIINAIYVSLTVTNGTVLYNNRTIGKCYSNTTNEIILLICELLLMIWSIINVLIFFILCKEYKCETLRGSPMGIKKKRFFLDLN